MTEVLSQLVDAIVKGEEDRAAPLTRQALDAGIQPDEIIQNGVAKGGEIIGAQFEQGEAFLPELFMAADAMKEAVDILRPLLVEGQAGSGAIPAIIGTVVGAPVTPTFAEDIGADLYAKYAAEGAELARKALRIG